MRRAVCVAVSVLMLAAACDTSVLGPERFREPDERSDPQPTQLLDGRWRVVQWTVTASSGDAVDVLALGGRIELTVTTGQSAGQVVIPDAVPGFAPATRDLNGVALARGQTATFQLVHPSFVGRATWSFGERHLALVRYAENGVETSVMLQRE